MISIICPGCGHQYEIDENRIPKGKHPIARCTVCDLRFKIGSGTGPRKPANDSGSTREAHHTARTIGVSLSKGGVGKTTTAVNLSAGLALAGFKVLLVDTDTQGQDSYMLGIKPAAGLSEFLLEELDEEQAIVKARNNLWCLAGGKTLGGVKRLIDRKSFGGEFTLHEALTPLESRFDFIIVDTSPGWDPLTVNVLFYVKEVLVPVSLAVMSLQGLVEFIKSLTAIQKYNKTVSLKYILPTFLDQRVQSPATILRKLKGLYGDYLCPPIRYNASFADAPAFGQTIYEFAPGSWGTEDYRTLVRKVTDDETLLK